MLPKEFLKKHGKSLRELEWFYSIDNNTMDESKWSTSKIRILIAFLSPGKTRSVASTANAINNIIQKDFPEAFIDFAIFPCEEDLEVFRKYQVPTWFGSISHKPACDFDVVGVSQIIIAERFNLPYALHSSGIPMGFYKRMKDETIPLIISGGISSIYGESLYGKFKDADGSEDECLVDLSYLGEAEKLPEFLKLYTEKKQEGWKKIDIIPDLVKNFSNIYYPLGYEIEYDGIRIVSNKRKYNWMPPFVYPHLEKVMDKRYNFDRKIINLDGTSVSSADILISSGCGGAGVCNFKVRRGTRIWTEFGIKRIESLVGESFKIQGLGEESCKNVLKQEDSIVYSINYDSGALLETDENHINMIMVDGVLKEVKTKDLKKGDCVLRKLGSNLVHDIYQKDSNNKTFNEDIAILLGFIHGDGHVRIQKNSTQFMIYFSQEELEYFKPILLKVFGEHEAHPFYETVDKGTLYEYTKNLQLEDFYNDELFLYKKSFELRVPEVVFNSPKSVICAYLRGLFQADGWHNRAIGLTSVSPKFLQDIHILLSYLGIDSHIGVNKWNERNPSLIHDCKISYFISVLDFYKNKFLEDVGFITKNNNFTHESWELSNGTISDVPNSHLLNNFIRNFYTREELEKFNCASLHRPPEGKYSFLTRYVLIKFLKETGISLPGIYPAIASGEFVCDFIDSVSTNGEVDQMYDVLETNTHLCVYNSILTHQCAEGWLMGPWRELPIEDIIELCHSSRKYSASSQASTFSFNGNFYSKYKELLGRMSELFPRLSLINMRADEIGSVEDTVHLAKVLGLNKLSLALEGLGPRIRNIFLNKNLPYKLFKEASKRCIEARFMESKFGMILTGRETKEDFDAAIDELKEIIEYRDSMGAKNGYRCNFTPIVSYEGTPIRWIERITAKNSLGNVKNLDYFLTRAREIKLRCKFNGRQFGTFIEQMFLDGGRLITKDIVEHSFHRKMTWYASWTISKFEPFVKDLCKHDIETLLGERPENWIYNNHRIHFYGHGAMLEAEQNMKNNKPTQYCLRTHANIKSNCHSGCFAKDPFVEIADIDIRNGIKPTMRLSELSGCNTKSPSSYLSKDYSNNSAEWKDNYLTYKGCNFCTTTEEKKSKYARELDSSYSVDNVKEAIASNQARQYFRVVVKKNSDYSFVSTVAIPAIVMSRFMLTVDDYEKYYHSIKMNNGYWASKGLGKSWWDGVVIFDVANNATYDIMKLKNKIPEVNKILKSCSIIDIIEISKEERVSLKMFNVFVFNTELPLAKFNMKVPLWNKSIKMYEKTLDGITVSKIDSSLLPPYVMAGGKGVVGCFYLPLQYNPSLFLSSILNVSDYNILSVTDFTNLGTFEFGDVVCTCGTEKVLFDSGQYKRLDIGLDCFLKKVMFLVKNKFNKL